MRFSLFKETIRMALGAIKSQLLRTILTVFIIAIGITALVGVLSAIGALENTIAGNFSSMGANTFNIAQYDFKNQRRNRRERTVINPAINYREVRLFEKNFTYPFSQTAIAFTGSNSAEIAFGNEKTDPEIKVLGINENFIDNSGLKLKNGRDFSLLDIENNSKTCIIGSDLRKELFKTTKPLGKTIRLRGVSYKIVGELASKGSSFGNNKDLRLYLPLTVARSVFSLPNINYDISIKVAEKSALEGAFDEAIVTFRKIRRLNPLEENNFGMQRSDDLLNRISEISSYLYFAAWIISIITIFGSSIALMNIMLVSVTERTREIGVRKALGAKGKTIAFQFFMETLIIGQLGGLLGIILGSGIGIAVAKVLDFAFTTPWEAMTWATIITFVVAIIAGSYPAIKASKQDPIESLRYE